VWRDFGLCRRVSRHGRENQGTVSDFIIWTVADVGLQESRAVEQKPRDAVVIFLSKFTAASRGPPCDSTALVFVSYPSLVS